MNVYTFTIVGNDRIPFGNVIEAGTLTEAEDKNDEYLAKMNEHYGTDYHAMSVTKHYAQ